MESQRAGNGHALLLAAGELVRVVVCPLREAHLASSSLACASSSAWMAFFVGLIIRPLLASSSPASITFCRAVYCGKRLKFWNTRPKWSRFLRISLSRWVAGVGGIPHGLTVDLDDAGIRPLQKVEAAQQRGFARTGGTNDRQRLAFFQSQ